MIVEGFLDYMAVTPNYQRHGLGKKISEVSFEKFKSDIPDATGLLMEIQREDVPNLPETALPLLSCTKAASTCI